MNYLPFVSWGAYGAASDTARANFWASWGLMASLPSGLTNNLNVNPLVFMTIAGATRAGRLNIIGIAWNSRNNIPIETDDDMAITDINDNPLFGKRAEADGDGLRLNFAVPLMVNGLKVPTLDGGVLYIYVR